MPIFKSICVVGGMENEKNTEFRSAAVDLGKAIAVRKINLVYGGGVRGLQGYVAVSAIKKGGGVLSISLQDGNTSNITCGIEMKAQTVFERFSAMFAHASAFIALPGGLETLEQIIALTFWAHKNVPQKFIGLLNVNGFYDHFLHFLDHAVEQKFMPQSMRRIIEFAPTAEQLFEKWQHPLFENTLNSRQGALRIDDSENDDEPDTTLRL